MNKITIKNSAVEKVSSVAGLGTLTLVPGPSANGTPLGTPPSDFIGCRIYLSGPDSLTFTIAGEQPSSPPAVTFTISTASTGPNWDENLSKGQMLYITHMTGAPSFRWF